MANHRRWCSLRCVNAAVFNLPRACRGEFYQESRQCHCPCSLLPPFVHCGSHLVPLPKEMQRPDSPSMPVLCFPKPSSHRWQEHPAKHLQYTGCFSRIGISSLARLCNFSGFQIFISEIKSKLILNTGR